MATTYRSLDLRYLNEHAGSMVTIVLQPNVNHGEEEPIQLEAMLLSSDNPQVVRFLEERDITDDIFDLNGRWTEGYLGREKGDQTPFWKMLDGEGENHHYIGIDDMIWEIRDTGTQQKLLSHKKIGDSQYELIGDEDTVLARLKLSLPYNPQYSLAKTWLDEFGAWSDSLFETE